MKITNKHNLPIPLASALKYTDYNAGGADISVTGLIQPPRIRQLEARHGDEITEDVSDLIWMMIGSIGHKILERADTNNHLPEERLMVWVSVWKISGKADLLGPDMILDDFKFTSVWAIKDEKPEWTAQLNCYAWLYRQHGFEVKRARIVAVLRDWSKPRAEREPDYPQVGVVVREVPLWSAEAQDEYVRQRLNLHVLAAEVTDDELPMCTEEERWHRPDVWAVKKKGNKRAIPRGLFVDRDLALQFARESPASGYEIEHRPGADVRCQSYCNVWRWCLHGQLVHSLKGQIGEDE